MDSPTLEQLAAEISDSTATLTSWLQANHLDQPRLNSTTGPEKFLQDKAPADVLKARESLISASSRLHTLAQWPFTAAQSFANTRAFDAQSLRCIIALKIPELIPLEGSASLSELAALRDVDQDKLARILRYCMTNGWFLEPSPGRIAHSAMSALLVTSDAIRGQTAYQTQVGVPASGSWNDALRASGEQDATYRASPFNLAFGTDMQSMKWALSDPERSGWFNDMLKAYQESGDLALAHMVGMFDWKGLGKGTLVDVGGNTGTTAAAIAASVPELHFIVQDLAAPIARGKDQLPDSLTSQIEFREHDFFNPQSIHAPSAFILRNVLHDWSDERAAAILKNLFAAMGSETKLLIVDTIVRAPGALPAAAEKRQRVLDLTMWTMMNSRERTEEDWVSLMKGTDEQAEIVETVTPAGSALSMMIVMKKGASS